MSVFFTRRGKAPNLGKRASDYAVGESVFLNVNGTPIEFLVVQQGNPNTSMYDESCNGTWLLMKQIYTTAVWNSSANYCNYSESSSHTWLNGDFLSLLDATTQSSVLQVNIPHFDKRVNQVASGSNGLSTKIFLLSAYEVGFTTSLDVSITTEGSCLSYFVGTANTDAKRIAYLPSGSSEYWWLRSCYTNSTTSAITVNESGGYGASAVQSSTNGVRPAMIISSNTRFDPTTNAIL